MQLRLEVFMQYCVVLIQCFNELDLEDGSKKRLQRLEITHN